MQKQFEDYLRLSNVHNTTLKVINLYRVCLQRLYNVLPRNKIKRFFKLILVRAIKATRKTEQRENCNIKVER